MPRTLIVLAFGLSLGTATAGDRDVIADPEIEAAVTASLIAAHSVQGNRIGVNVAEGVVTLNGVVSDILARERAARVTRSLRGVRSVVNQLSVRESRLPDADIERHVEQALLEDPVTEPWEIEADVTDGTVTLQGEVDSFVERELAVKIAKGVYGVRAVGNHIKVNVAVNRLDHEIEEEIARRLHWDARVDGHLVNVSSKDGQVALSGAVGSAQERLIARRDAWVAGVSTVNIDDLEVRWWAADDTQREQRRPTVDDAAIERAITDAFLHDPRVLSFRPDITVADGIVTLSGSVDTVKARRAAAEDAANTTGVWKVNNNLKVVPGNILPDERVELRVLSALDRDVVTWDEDIEVGVDFGKVRLFGEVGSYFAREQAEDLAARIGGVVEVDNRLRVDYEVPGYGYAFHDWDPVSFDYDFDRSTVRQRPDWEIAEDIEHELWWSPFVDADEVTVHVRDGKATLTGIVDSWHERAAAAENAVDGGALKVINELDVNADG